MTKWIPVSKKMPKKKGSYLLCLDNDYISTAYYDGNQWYIGSEKERIVAWMPLPKPYRAESEEV